MRTYGRINQVDGTGGQWVEVSTTPQGFDDQVYLTTLVQVLKLNLGESPFYANYGIPAYQSVMQQVIPDFYVTYTQQQFAQYFASLIVSKRPTFQPTYDIRVTTNQGDRIDATVQVPT